MRTAMEQQISRLQREYARGEEELWRARQRVAYLEAALERFTGGILALKEALRHAQDTPPSVPVEACWPPASKED